MGWEYDDKAFWVNYYLKKKKKPTEMDLLYGLIKPAAMNNSIRCQMC